MNVFCFRSGPSLLITLKKYERWYSTSLCAILIESDIKVCNKFMPTYICSHNNVISVGGKIPTALRNSDEIRSHRHILNWRSFVFSLHFHRCYCLLSFYRLEKLLFHNNVRKTPMFLDMCELYSYAMKK